MNPFPGMNPYLEARQLWPHVHARLILQMADALNAVLPPRYTTTVEERMIVVDPFASYRPDVAVIEGANGGSSGSQMAVAVADAPIRVTIEESREHFVEILDLEAQAQTVCVLEVLSHYNKRAGEGKREYKAKQERLLDAEIHLLEIDLLRAGRHAVAAPESLLPEERDYAVCLHRAGAGGHFEVWTSSVRERLPRVWVPLLEPDPDVVLDIGAAVNAIYDAGRFASRISYNTNPEPPLSPDDDAWSDVLLRETGLRHAE